MKSKLFIIITGLFLYTTLVASPVPTRPIRDLDEIDTVKAALIYALGEWDNPQHTHHHAQNTPLPGYALDICNESALAPTIPHYYKEVSQSRFMVDVEAWHNNGNCYVMEGFHTPKYYGDTITDDFVLALIDRIDDEGVWSFADNAMYYPDNDNPAPSDTPFVWVFVFWPEPYGNGWGLAPGVINSFDIKTNRTLNGDTIFAHIFGYSRQPSPHKDDAVGGVVHEFNHQWLPDVGYNEDHYGLGGFEPQGAGLGFYDDQGGPPAPVNPAWRYELGWMDKAGWTGNLLDQVIQDQTSGKVYSAVGSNQSNRFFVSCHRNLSYYERCWPGEGLLIWHSRVGGTRYGRDNEWGLYGRPRNPLSYLSKPIDLEAAHGLWDWDTLSMSRVTANPVTGRDNLDMRPWDFYEDTTKYHGAGDSTCFFWPDFGYTQFDGLTNPSSRERKHVWGIPDSVSDTFGVYRAQRIAVRRIQKTADPAMKADFLYNYCIGGTYPNIPVSCGANNQRSMAVTSSTLNRCAIVYVDDDPRVMFREGEVENTHSALTDLAEDDAYCFYQGDSASYPALYIKGTNNSQAYFCWLDGSALYYRYGYLDSNEIFNRPLILYDSIDLAAEFDWPGFTAPSIVVDAGDTVYIGVGVSMPQMPTGPGPTYFPVLCFRFYKWDPENAIVDTLAMLLVDTTMGLGIGSSVSLAIDEHDRVHAVYQINSGGNTITGHRYYVPDSGAWSGTVAVFTTNGYGAGSPCLGTYPGYLVCVASVLDNTHAYRNIYRTILYVGGATIPGTWNTPTLISADTAHAWGPVTAGKNHIFWHENGELLYMDKNPDPDTTATISHTPHAWSSSPQAVYDATNGNCYVAWRESNNFGSEIDLRTISEGGSSGGGGGSQSSGKITLERISLELSNTICSDGKLDIRYTLSVPSEKALLTIYDCQGRLVRQWPVANSQGTIQWNGYDRYNRKVSSGVYFVRLACNKTQTVEKTLMIK